MRLHEKEFQETYKATLKWTPIKVTVSGLEELDTFDLFEDLEIKESGVAPDGQLEVKSPKYPDLHWTLSRDSGLSNGDKVTISISDRIENIAEQYHALPKSSEMEYTMSHLPSYLTNLSDFPDQLNADIQKEIKTYVDSTWTGEDNVSLVDYQFLGYYLLLPEEDHTITDIHDNRLYNELFAVYKVTLHTTSDEIDEIMPTYLYYMYKNASIGPDGVGHVDLEEYERPQPSGWFEVGEYFTAESGGRYLGYPSVNNLYEERILDDELYFPNITNNIQEETA